MTKKSLIFLALSLSLLCGGLGFVTKYYSPKVKPFLVKELKKQTKPFVKLGLKVENIDFNWLPLSLTIKELEITPVNDVKKVLSPFNIKNLIVKISLIELFKGNLVIDNIKISDSTLNIIIKKFGSKNESKLENFKFLKKIPIDTITLKKVNLYLKLEPISLSLKADNIEAHIENLRTALITEVIGEKITLKNSLDSKLFSFDLNSKFLMDDRRIIVSKLTANHSENTYISLMGQLKGKWLKKEIDKFNIDTTGQLQAEEVLGIINSFLPQVEIPESRGVVQFDVNYNDNKLSFTRPKLEVKTQDFYIKDYQLGDLEADAVFQGNRLILDHLKVENKYVNVSAKNNWIELTKEMAFESHLNIKKFKLWNLLKMFSTANEDIKKKAKSYNKLIVDLIAQGSATCKGTLRSKLQVFCDAKAHDSQFLLTEIKNKEDLIAVKGISAKAKLKITDRSISYDGNVYINKSKAMVDGQVNFKTGFTVNFEGEVDEFASDLDKLLKLELAGNAIVKGSVKGNARTAVLTTAMSCKDCSIKQWQTGDFDSYVKYADGILTFSEISGVVGKDSRHNSQVSVNIKENSLFVNSNFSNIELKDIHNAIKANIPLPFTVESAGKANLKLWGPLKLQDLSFSLKSDFKYGFINKESFDEAKINIECKDGNIQTKVVQLKKADSTLHINGYLKRSGQLLLNGRINSFQLKNSEYFSSLKTEMDGDVNLNATLIGTFHEPVLNINGLLNNTNFGLNKSKASRFKLSIDKKAIKADVTLNKDQFTSKVIYPFKKGDIYISSKAKNWNFSHILVGFFPHFKKFNLYTNFNGSTDIVIPEKDINKMEGTLNISSFFIFRGTYSVYLEKPLNLTFKSGHLHDFNVGFKGQRTDLKLSSKNSSFRDMNLSAKGRFDLGVGLIFSSFVEEFRGDTSVSLGFNGPIDHLNVFGSIYVQNSTLKLIDLRQPIEHIQAEFTIKNRAIFLNSLVGKFGGGQVNGSGQIEFIGLYPQLNLKGRIQGSEFKSIEGVNLFLDADVTFKGSQLPYLLTADAHVLRGEINKTVQIDNKNKNKFKLSDYAPRDIIATKEKAINLDVTAHIDQSIPLKIVTSQFEFNSAVIGNIKVTNTPQKPLLNGKLNFTGGGTILFRSNQYNLKTGYLTYENNAPNNPFLYIDAEGRVQDYDIQISVLGSGKDPKINFQSQPNLPQAEIINLVALGYTSSDLDNEISSRQQTDQITYEVSSAILKERLGLTRGVNDKLGLEFDISSTYNDDQSNPIPTLTLKKRLGNKIEATASRTIESSATSSFKTEYKFNKNLSTIFSITKEEANETSNDENSGSEALGLDFEYKIEFK